MIILIILLIATLTAMFMVGANIVNERYDGCLGCGHKKFYTLGFDKEGDVIMCEKCGERRL